MRLSLAALTAVVPATAWAESFQRPIPQPQTSQAEVAYFTAALVFLAALVVVQWLVNRK